MMKIEGSGSESISKRHRSADPDPHQNVMDQQHWLMVITKLVMASPYPVLQVQAGTEVKHAEAVLIFCYLQYLLPHPSLL
jgi:hypothetical protein